VSCNIVNEYVDFSKKMIKNYLEIILERYFDQDIYDDLINAYINTRYFNMYFNVEPRFEVNIVYYLKKSLEGKKDDSRYIKKSKYMFHVFKYILYFDSVRECDSVRPLIAEISDFRKGLGLNDEQFESKFYNLLKDDLTAKKEFIDSFDDKNFTINYLKVNNDQIFDCQLEQNLKFPKLYSEYIIDKVFNNRDINEQKLFVTYSLVGCKILQDIIKGNFQKSYLVDYSLSLKDKPKKKKRLLNILDNDITKEKIALKISYSEYLEYKEEIYELTRSGFKIALITDKNFVLNEENSKLLIIFSYIITSDSDLYDHLKDYYNILFIPS
jgi:hypothetical protein